MITPGRWLDLDDGSELDAIDELPADVVHVQFRRRLTDARYERLGRLLAARPEVSLRVYHGDDVPNVEFLRWFPGLRSFAVDAMWPGVSSLEGLRHVSSSLERLVIGRTKRPLSLAILGELPHLRSLAVEGQHRSMETISGIESLASLTLRSVTLPDLRLVVGLPRLIRLDLKLGGTKDLGLLPQLPVLEELELWRVRGLTDLRPIERTLGLRSLFLQTLPRVRTLPDLHRLERLDHVTLHTMKGITDLSPLAACPALETLMLIAMSHLRPESVRPLVGHPTLRRGNWNIGSMHKTYQAQDILPILPEPAGYAEWRASRTAPRVGRSTARRTQSDSAN